MPLYLCFFMHARVYLSFLALILNEMQNDQTRTVNYFWRIAISVVCLVTFFCRFLAEMYWIIRFSLKQRNLHAWLSRLQSLARARRFALA